MNRTQAAVVHKEINEALAAIAARHKMVIHGKTMRFDDNGFSLRLEGKSVVSSSDTETVEAITAVARRMCDMAGLDPNAPNGRGWKIVDYNGRATRMPWIVKEASTGKRYKITDYSARSMFKADKTPKDRAVDRMADEVMSKTGTYDAVF